ncbi:MAG: heme A synthase [Ilumatobacteraceae bacterium]|nr:heme A synthase [Ilumatobacteraceae bacterium]
MKPSAYCGGVKAFQVLRKRPVISPEGYVRITRTALLLLCIIVVSGAAVRLSGSGLGCSDWPRCNAEKFVDVSTFHGAIEQVNRLFTGLVAAVVIVAVLAARYRIPYRRDLLWMAWGLVLGVAGQVILGGIVVLTDLNPIANLGHFILSMFLVANAFLLLKRSQENTVSIERQISSVGVWVVRLVCVCGGIAIFTGTIVTGSGPHAGDEKARRLGFEVASAAKVHGTSVIIMIALMLVLAGYVRRTQGLVSMKSALEIIILTSILQATVGYVQYFNDIPALLVGIHVFGATLFFISLVNLWLIGHQTFAAKREIVERKSIIV